LPAGAHPQPLSLREHQGGNGAIHRRIWDVLASVAHIKEGLSRDAVIDEHGLLAVLVLEVAVVLTRAAVIDVGRSATVSRVVVANRKDWSIDSMGGCAHNQPRSLSRRRLRKGFSAISYCSLLSVPGKTG
jgi:hypothetical protein